MANKICDQKIRTIWAVILLAGLILFFLTGCGSKKTVTEKIVTKTDSAAVVSLQTELNVKNTVIENLKTILERIREENTRLLSESSSHTINYDTGAPVNPETGEYPKSSETKTESKVLLDKTIKEMETLKQEHEREVETLEQINSSLESMVKLLKQENSALKTKTTPVFNLKSFLSGIVAGMILLILLFVRK